MIKPLIIQHVAMSAGTSAKDMERLREVIGMVPNIKFICLDVANGYSEHFVETVKQVRSVFPN